METPLSIYPTFIVKGSNKLLDKKAIRDQPWLDHHARLWNADLAPNMDSTTLAGFAKHRSEEITVLPS